MTQVPSGNGLARCGSMNHRASKSMQNGTIDTVTGGSWKAFRPPFHYRSSSGRQTLVFTKTG
jgi:hypothetical protein